MTTAAAANDSPQPAPKRLRRVNRASETHPRHVAAVLPLGYGRPATQSQWHEHLIDVLDSAPVRDDRRATLRVVAEELMRWADWDTLTTRPTWDRLIKDCKQRLGRGSWSTIGRAIATLIKLNVIARVSAGRRGCFAPGGHLGHRHVKWRDVPQHNRASDPINEAAVYVLLVPVPLHVIELPPDHAAVDENDIPTAVGLFLNLPVRAREDLQAEPLRGTQTDGAPQAAPPPPIAVYRHDALWPGWETPGSDAARLSAAAELQRRLPVLRQISTRDVRSCLRKYFLAGWTVDDVHHALDHQPDHTRWPHDGARGIGPTGVRGWIAYRLRPWTTDGTPRLSFTQRAAAERAEELAQRQTQAQRAAEDRANRGPATETPPPVYLAARAHLRHQRQHTTDPHCPACAGTTAAHAGDPPDSCPYTNPDEQHAWTTAYQHTITTPGLEH